MKPAFIVTRSILQKWDACYTDDEIAELVPPEGGTVRQLIDHLAVPVCDKIWTLLHVEVVGFDGLVKLSRKWADRSAWIETSNCADYAARAARAASRAASRAARAAAAAEAAAAASNCAADEAAAAADAADAERDQQLNDIREYLSI